MTKLVILVKTIGPNSRDVTVLTVLSVLSRIYDIFGVLSRIYDIFGVLSRIYDILTVCLFCITESRDLGQFYRLLKMKNLQKLWFRVYY